MSEYTFRERAVRPKVAYIGYKDYSYDVQDDSLTSSDYFEIVEFPSKLTAGKNLIKLRGNRENLVDNSNINVEILDYNNDPVFYKPITYVERDGTRVIAIYIYPETAPGPARIFLTGRALRDLNGRQLRFSQDYNDPDFLNKPNLIWARSIAIAPNEPNSTEIIFVRQPKVTITESVQPYLQPVTTNNVFTKKLATGIASNLSQGFGYQTAAPVSTLLPIAPASLTNDGNNITQPIVSANVFTSNINVGDTIETSGATVTSSPTSIVVGSGINFSLSPTSTSTEQFKFSSSMANGVLVITNPLVQADPNAYVFGTVQNGFDVAVPIGVSVVPTKMVQVNSSGQVRLYGTWTFGIKSITNATTARVVQIDGYTSNNFNTNDVPLWRFRGGNATQTSGFPNMNTEAAFTAGGYGVISNRILSANNFTASFIEPYVVTQTENSASFADIILSDIEPETGDVFKIKTLYKPSGMFGDFIDLGDSILEEQELLIDTQSFETNVTVGAAYEHYGRFESLSEINQYWEVYKQSEIGVYGTLYELNLVLFNFRTTDLFYDSENLLGGTKLNFEGSITAPNINSYLLNQGTLFRIKSAYQPKLYANTTYKVRAKLLLHSTDSLSVDPRIPFPRLDVYISGSQPTLLSENIIVNGNAFLPNNWQETLTGDFANRSIAGYHLGTVTCAPVINTRVDIEFVFQVNEDVPKANIGFMLRSGDWTIADIELKSYKESGFSPNYVRIGKRVPTEHLKTPLTFKFQYYDYTGRLANQQTAAYGVVFQGDNFYIDGVNNILTGSLFLGNTIGTGVEMAGVNSAFIRSVGYYGYSASLATGNGKNGGFLIYSGSVLPQEKNKFSGNTYKGVGMELVSDDDSGHLIFHTNPSILDIKARSFFIGNTNAQFISGANSNIEISSSLFHLDPVNNRLVIGADAVINATLTTDEIITPATIAGAPSTVANASSSILSNGYAKFVSASIGGFNVTPSQIRSTNNNVVLRSNGQITGSELKLTRTVNGTPYTYVDTVAGVADFSNVGRVLYVPTSMGHFSGSTAVDMGTGFKTLELSTQPNITGSVYFIPLVGESKLSISFNWRLGMTDITGLINGTISSAQIRAKIERLITTGSISDPDYWDDQLAPIGHDNSWLLIGTSTAKSLRPGDIGGTAFTVPRSGTSYWSGWLHNGSSNTNYQGIDIDIPITSWDKLCRLCFDFRHDWSNSNPPDRSTQQIGNIILQFSRGYGAASNKSGFLVPTIPTEG